MDVTRNYYNSLFVFEDCDNEKFRNKRPEILKMILRSYARNISSESSKQTIIEDIRQSNERTFDTKTFDDYLEALNDLFIISDIQSWNPNIRSKTSMASGLRISLIASTLLVMFGSPRRAASSFHSSE